MPSFQTVFGLRFGGKTENVFFCGGLACQGTGTDTVGKSTGGRLEKKVGCIYHLAAGGCSRRGISERILKICLSLSY
jgi:hypothetical protein